MPDQPSADWVAQVTDTIVRTIGTLRDRTTKPAITIARGLVFGIMASILGMVAVVLLAVLVVRVIENYLPGGVWKSHFITGALFCVGGLILMFKRHSKAES